MIVTFEEEYLRDLYEKGKTDDKKHRYQPEIVRKYKRCIDILSDASGTEALYEINSLNKNIMITLKGVDPRMIANNLTPYEPTHPGEVLKEEIEYRGISQRKLASQMDVSYTLLNEVLNCKRPVLTEYALLFEAALGIEAEMLIKMQARYNMYVTKRNSKFIEKLSKISRVAAIF